jgi:hypothetical protein
VKNTEYEVCHPVKIKYSFLWRKYFHGKAVQPPNTQCAYSTTFSPAEMRRGSSFQESFLVIPFGQKRKEKHDQQKIQRVD